ncbi:MAG: radical SAM protein [Acidobacteriota bacterium]
MLSTATLITQNYRKLESPPLGTLVVAERLQELGVKVELFDLAEHWLAEESVGQACRHCADLLAQESSEFFGFSTIAGVMPITVQIALELRARRPDSVIGFGGPGVSAVSRAFAIEFPEFDFILQGEVEGALPAFVETFGLSEFNSCPNLVMRNGGASGEADSVLVNPLAPLPNSFPTPSYKRWGYGNGFSVAPVEVGRGCPYNCKFCCTSAFFSRQYRIKDAPNLIAELDHLLTEFQPQQVSFVHDLFTVDDKRVAHICQELIRSNVKVSWQCSSRIGCISEELIDLMARAGCQNIVFGIETGSRRMQKIIGKNLPVERTFDVAEACAARGIAAGCSFILGFPEETKADLSETLELWMDLMAIRDTEPHGAILAALGGTGYYGEHFEQSQFTELHTRALPARSGVSSDEAGLIRAHPHVFPEFYALPYAPLTRLQLKLAEEFMNSAGKTIRYLLVGLRRMRMSGIDIVLQWFDYAGLDMLAKMGEDYFSTAGFVRSFMMFYRSVLESATLPQAERLFLGGLAAAYDVMDREQPQIDPLDGPVLTAGACVVKGNVSINHLPLRLRPDVMPEEALLPTWYLHLTRAGRCKTFELHQTLGEVLSHCDGRTSIEEIARRVGVLGEGRRNEAAVEYLMTNLASEGYVHMPSRVGRAAGADRTQEFTRTNAQFL